MAISCLALLFSKLEWRMEQGGKVLLCWQLLLIVERKGKA